MRVSLLFAVSSLPLAAAAQAPDVSAALRPVATWPLPAEITGSFDHFELDAKRGRLFATPEDAKEVLVLDVATGKLLATIPGVAQPHAVLYRADLDRLYVTDGGDGSLKVYDAASYKLLSRVPLLLDADSIGYDAPRKLLYVDNGGGDMHQSYSMLSVVDTTADRKLADLRIEGDTLEAMALDSYRPRLYVNDKAKNTVVVVDRFKGTIVSSWPVTLGKTNVAMALDEQRQRLFVACRDGHIVVMDTNTGQELQALSITKGVDELIFDPGTRRLYAVSGGMVDVYDQTTLDSYQSRGSLMVGNHARTGKLVPALNRLFVAEPAGDGHPAAIHVLEPVSTRQPDPPLAVPQIKVDAPRAERLVLATLSAHPALRRMGLHVIPPGGQGMVLIANGNAARIGIATSQGDFAATAGGKISGPLIADGAFYNMKMLMFDASGRSLGILVMEVPATAATGESDAAAQAEVIRAELAAQIPSREWLFQRSKKVRSPER